LSPIEILKSLFKEGIPCLGHVGLIPQRTTWTGGFKAVGKNSDEAIKVYEDCLSFKMLVLLRLKWNVCHIKLLQQFQKK
jgi:3-methyl-2-oxobutanoate hydroxymethyltransferase